MILTQLDNIDIPEETVTTGRPVHVLEQIGLFAAGVILILRWIRPFLSRRGKTRLDYFISLLETAQMFTNGMDKVR